MPTQVRDWAEVDYYGLLGVAPDASDDEIARVFRALAKQLHPDRIGSRGTEQQHRFKQITAAYEVLSNPRMRRDYDSVRAQDAPAELRPRPVPMGRVPRAPATPLIRWTPFKARAAMVLGVLCLCGGVAMSVFMVGVHQREVNDQRGRVAVKAITIDNAQGQVVITFNTTDGHTITVPPPHRINPGVLDPGESMAIRYLRSDPTNVISNESHFARDFTLWFVAVKLLFGAPFIFYVGLRRLRLLRRARANA
ncbi:MAG TPA: J domain-containing protein [Acidimicrobiia bacterium]